MITSVLNTESGQRNMLYGVRMVETTETKRQLGLGQIGLLRIGERSTAANRCSQRTMVGDFGLKCPYEA